MLELITFSLLNGIVYGLLLLMLSSGLTLIWSMMGVLNFAHASMFMLGAYFSYQIARYIGFWPALVVAPVLVGTAAAHHLRAALIGAGSSAVAVRPEPVSRFSRARSARISAAL